jgi:hypothetical protein
MSARGAQAIRLSGKADAVHPPQSRFGESRGGGEAVAVELCCQLSGKTQQELAAHFGYISESSMGKQRKRLAALAGTDAPLAAKIAKLKETLS